MPVCGKGLVNVPVKVERLAMVKVLAACVAGALVFVWSGLALAWGAAVVQWGRTAGTTWTGWDVTGVAIALAWAVGCATVLGYVGRRWSDRVFIGVASGVALAVGLGWAWATRWMENWPMDSGLYRWFLERLAEGGFSPGNLEVLRGKTDYALWVGRALPMYPFRLAVGENAFGLAVQMAQAIVGALGVWIAWRLARLLFGCSVARWVAVGIVSMPAYGMQSIGWNHQVWGSFYFLAGISLLAEWLRGERKRGKRWGLAILATAMTVAMCLEGYVGKLYLSVAVILLGWECLQGAGRKRLVLGAFIWLVLVPGGIAWCMMGCFHHRLATQKMLEQHGGQLAFLARGWDMQTWGEYADTVDHIDLLTPPKQKDHVIRQYIAGQCAYNGNTLVTKLFPAKLAKFMLAGYASLAEEVLWANGAERTGRVARGMRTGWFVLVYAPLMLWGLWKLSRRVGMGDGGMAWLVLPVAMFGAAVMVAGETSPRYAMPVQALLIALGACGWAWGGREEGVEEEPVLTHPFAVGMALVMVGYGLFAGGILGGREFWKRYALADMRETVLEGGYPSGKAYQEAFEAVFPNGKGSVTWPGKGGGVTVYLRGKSWRETGWAEISTREEGVRKVELPVRVEINWEEDEARRLVVRRTEDAEEVWIGYADVREAVEP